MLPLTEALRTRVAPLVERVAWGGERRERLLLAGLDRHYGSLFRRQWRYAREMPHFFDHRIGSFAFAIGKEAPFSYYRGFFAAELVRPGDTLLDLGCGDGFFARRFYAPRCAQVDAIDIEPSAIEHARRRNAAPNVRYVLTDAVADPFPSERYDVVVWDGALAHFAADTAERVLEKVRASLAPDGAFCGSEALGEDAGHDHLQVFATLYDLAGLLGRVFPHVQVKAVEYEIASGELRREAFWRCAVDPARLEAAAWRDARAPALAGGEQPAA
jgi:SAM-dependent methyltransferase